MEISAWYKDHFETQLMGRYIHLEHLQPLLDFYSEVLNISSIGTSENGKKIPCIEIGHGSKTVFAWSQMHGNESTTTKAIFDFLKFLTQKNHFQKEIISFLNTYTLHFIPILNPDGAYLYTRENANGIDLNRDAKRLSQSESKALRAVFDRITPDLCLNLHDQRTIYSLPRNKPATVSFLSPAANKARTVTSSRKEAMRLVAKMTYELEQQIPGQVGRYDDTFNDNCVGDSFQNAGVPTILFEAGHYQGDYGREKTREYIFYAFLSLFDITKNEDYKPSSNDYFNIPENEKCFRDIIISNVDVSGKIVSLAIQYEERLENNRIHFVPKLEKIADLGEYLGHIEVDAKNANILLNSHENVFENVNVVKIVNKYATEEVFFIDSCISF